MRLLFTGFSFFLFNLSCIAGRVTGTITDSSGKALPYASVFIKENKKGTNANSEGKYVLQLPAGDYTIVCQHVGYTKAEQRISISENDLVINFQLSVQEMTLSEVILTKGEDPAYQIIRNAIEKKTYYQQQLEQFRCEVYTKGQLRLRGYPKKVFGQKVDFEDGDTSKQKMLYLSESIAIYSKAKPDKAKVEVISSKVSGQTDGFGLSAPGFFSFYDNNISIGQNLNPRGFISPIADNALNFYKYKLEGSYWEDGREVNHIKVTPKRRYEPLFNGYIDIIEDNWNIHSVKLELVKASQMEVLDTLRIEQLYRPIAKDNWFIASQVIYPAVKMLGFDAYGSFINIYSAVEIEPAFTKKTFSNTVLKYSDSANKKTNDYWEKIRPLPLMIDEVADYKKKDILELVRKSPRYLDSLDKKNNKLSLSGLFLTGQSFAKRKKQSSFSISPLITHINFNPAEGFFVHPEFTWRKKLDTVLASRKNISIAAVTRYGFSNKHFNSYLSANYSFGKKHAATIYLSGGKRVFQFNADSPITELGNTLTSLLFNENILKSYEAYYVRGSYRQEQGNGFSWVAAFQYQDRLPLNNTTNYTWRRKANIAGYTPNYPNEIVNENIKRHQVFTALAGIEWQPGTKYVELPDRKINIGSKLPVFGIRFVSAINNLFGSDASFTKWQATVSDNANLKLGGLLRYRLGVGGFLDDKKMQLPDYTHFNGNISVFATEYLNSFQVLPIYQYSNTASFYSLAHVEYNLKGFLTNKIPVIKKMNLYLVTGANGFYINSAQHYYEWFVGLDNIFKIIRIDFVQSYQQGKSSKNGFRIGFNTARGKRGDDWP